MIYNVRPDFGMEGGGYPGGYMQPGPPPEQELPHEPRSREPLTPAQMHKKTRECFGVMFFLLTTILMCFELAMHIWLLVIFAGHERVDLLGVGVLIIALTSIFTAFFYSLQMKRESVKANFSMACCLLFNFPLPLGIIFERMVHLNAKAEACCNSKDYDRFKKDWIFAKLKLAQSTFQSLPFSMLALYSYLQYEDDYSVHYGAFLTSFWSLVIAAGNHEVIRKERLRRVDIGILQSLYVGFYKFWIITGRVLGLALFTYFYHQWVVAVIVPHIVLMFGYLFGVYREVWKVDVFKVIMHSFYSVVAYFPIHNEYRPMGELLGFYILFMAENIIMVALPNGVHFYSSVNSHHFPGTLFYHLFTVGVLVFSALGLIFMTIYYFCVHRSSESVWQSNLKCLPRGCPCCHVEEEEYVPKLPPEGRRIYRQQNETNAAQATQPRMKYPSHLLDETGPPPSYRSQPQSMADGLDDYRGSGDGDSDTKEPLTDEFKPVFDEEEIDIGLPTGVQDHDYKPPPRRFKKKSENAYWVLGYMWNFTWCQKQVFRSRISNCIPQFTVECNYLYLP